MESSITKSLIRKTVLAYRKLLPTYEYEKRNSALLDSLYDLILRRGIQSIHLFLAIADKKEPDIFPLLPALWKRQIITIASISDFKKREMHHFFLDNETKLKCNHLGIPEPVMAVKTDMNVDAILIPLLVADRAGNRIGYGGGFYDKLLSETKAVKIGLSLAYPVDQIIQTDSWDVPLNFLITPYKTYDYG